MSSGFEPRFGLPLGRQLSGALYRLTARVQKNPIRATLLALGIVAGTILYDAKVIRSKRVPSAHLYGILEYEKYDTPPADGPAPPVAAAAVAASPAAPAAAAAAPAAAVVAAPTPVRSELDRALAAAQGDLRVQLGHAVATRREIVGGGDASTLVVTSGQLHVREPRWQLRSMEHNWTVLARDRQQQEDKYWYRADRGREDDYGRHSYGGR